MAGGADATWQWQLQGTTDTSVEADVYNVDGFDVSRATVQGLKAEGRRTICYISAGSFENWRPDAASFPAAVMGKALDGWAGERWLDIRALDTLKPILRARLDMCRRKGL